jgi:hypothetical protein
MDIREIALLFDLTASGSLFIADLEWVRSGKQWRWAGGRHRASVTVPLRLS